jgi:hypothetical protein
LQEAPCDIKQQELGYLQQLLQDCNGEKALAAQRAGSFFETHFKDAL